MAEISDEARHRQNVIKAVIVVALIAFVAFCSQFGSGPADAPAASVAKLSDEAVAKCRELLALGEANGIIRARPKPTRIDVEDALWAQLPADVKDRTLQAVSCDVWQTAMPPSAGDPVVAYGYRSGKRVQMLTGVGMARE
jgi:hypothetical protein